MEKKSLNPIMRRAYRNLERREKQTLKKLSDITQGHSYNTEGIVLSAYNAVTDGDRVDYSRLKQKVDKQTAHAVETNARNILKMCFPDYDPFRDLNFDELNREQSVYVEFATANLQNAARVRTTVNNHLHDYIADTLPMFEEYLDLVRLKANDLALAVQDIAQNKKYPIDDTVFNNAIQLAVAQQTRVLQLITRGVKADDAVNEIKAYTEKKDSTDGARLLTTEGTRATVETAKEVVEPYAKAFYSETVGDGKVCKVCDEIADNQEANPVPIEDFISGETAPPFHTNCRCSVEVIWSDD